MVTRNEQIACHVCENYGPNEITIEAIEKLEKDEDVEYHESAEAFWESFYK